MNQNLNKYFSSFVLYIFLPIAVAKLIWSGALYFLDKDALIVPKEKDYIYHYNINLAQNIVGGKKASQVKQVTETHNRIDDIKLKGTYASSDANFIILEDNLGTTFLYLNEKYVGYKLIEIYDNRAVLSKNGQKYDIVLSDSVSTIDSKNDDSSSTRIDDPKEIEEFVLGEPTKITRDELNSYVKNPNKIWKNIRIQELRKDGELGGFRVNYVKKGSFFQKAGLKSGDVIKSVDGKEIKSLADVMKYYSNIDNLSGLSISVTRGSEELDLEFNVN